MNCTRCEGTGFLNLHQVDDATLKRFDETGDHDFIRAWIDDNEDHDVSVCDCCGDGTCWYGIPGEHYTGDDPSGPNGPYAYNGGLCECN
jgi:hypothetical protein